MNSEVEHTAEHVATEPLLYRGFQVVAARTAGKFRVLNANAGIVVPLSLRIFDSREGACRAVREHLHQTEAPSARSHLQPHHASAVGHGASKSESRSEFRLPGVPLETGAEVRAHRPTTVERPRASGRWAITLLREVREVMTQLRDRR